ncbi:MAG: radical SAM protein [Euryarchaeota archaeon]|nr:radical SAM protein [Euryarchaeota archaeon]
MASLAQYLGPARSLCPTCLKEAPGGYFTQAGKVTLQRNCPDHGKTTSPFWGDVEHYRWTQQIEQTALGDGSQACCAPGTPGCGGDATSRRCVTVVPITDACNLECSYCFASSGPAQTHRSLDEVGTMLRGAFRESGGPTPIQLSGGEPTIHPDILSIIADARRTGFSHIEVNTNGILVANRPGFAESLHDAGVTALYLQFDGTTDPTYRATRDADLWDVKQRAVQRAREAGLTVILVPTVVPGVNEHELGSILRFALKNRDVVRGVNIQPVRHFGRFAEDSGHLSLDRVAKLLEEQTGYLRARDLFPVPCCSSACYAATILLPSPGGAVPLTRYLSEATFLKALANAGERRFMDVLAGTPDAQQVAKDVACACGIPFSGLAAKLMKETVLVSVTGFMDSQTVDLDRMGRCCVRVATRDGQLAPFCGYYLTDEKNEYAWRNHTYPADAPKPNGVNGHRILPRTV